MAYAFTFTPRFQKHFKNLTVQEKKQLKNKLQLLAENPSHPSLRTKRIQGTTDLFECSVNMDIRLNADGSISNFLRHISLFGIDANISCIFPLTNHLPERILNDPRGIMFLRTI